MGRHAKPKGRHAKSRETEAVRSNWSHQRIVLPAAATTLAVGTTAALALNLPPTEAETDPTARPPQDRGDGQRADRDHTRSPNVSSPKKATAPATPAPTVSRPFTPVRPGDESTGSVLETGSCKASFYSEPQDTASGERFDPDALTTAHKSLPMDSRVRVTNSETGASVVVRVNDRGPFSRGRCLDLSRAAFKSIADLDRGVVKVRYEVLSK